MTRKPLFWAALAALAIAGGTFALRFYGEAFPVLAVNVEMSRAEALEAAAALAEAAGWQPADYSQAASFRQTDPEVQTYVELEGGGSEVFAQLAEVGPFRPYVWEVRQFAEGDVAETRVRFTPEGRPYGFVETLAESAGRPTLTPDTARALAEQEARTRWGVDLGAYRPIEASQEVKPSGRTDHTFVYERDDPALGDAAVRLRLVVAGDKLSELTHFVFIPEAFLRRYQEMRSANDALALLSNLVFLVGFLVLGCGVGTFLLLKQGWIVWRPALAWAFAIALLLGLGTLNQLPLAWMDYDTALSRSLFVLEQIGLAVSIVVFGTPMLAFVFLSAESLTRRAFPKQPQQWRLWSRDAARSDALLGRTGGAYLWSAVDLGYVVGFYLLASRLPGWWIPSEAIVDPDLLSTPFPWPMALSLSAFAGFWEESLFRAVPIAGAKLLGDRFGGTRAWIAVALVVQALVFAAAHANYPQQPPYARIVELFLPALIWGFIYLGFGLLPTILIHFLHNFTFSSIVFFNASVPGIWVDRVMSIALMLTPLAIVVIQRIRGGRLRELPDELRNVGWRPKETAVAAPAQAGATIERPSPVAHEVAAAPPSALTRPRVLAIAGAVGALLALFLTDLPDGAPPLSIDRAEALSDARSTLQSQSASVDGWEALGRVDGAPGVDARFVWETSGQEAYRSLLGSYLLPPLWQVRFARFTGPLEERAEEWVVTVGPTGETQEVVHRLPEDRPGAALEEADARRVAEPRAQTEAGEAARVREISAEARQRPARRDWLFTFVVEGGPALDQGELRIQVEVAGDEVVAARRLVHIPEAWEREERGRATRQTIIQLGSTGILALLLLAAAVAAVVIWSRGTFAAGTFAGVALAVVAVQTASGLNGYPSARAGFSTAQPLGTQLLTLGTTLLLTALIAAGALGMLAGLAHTWLWRSRESSWKASTAAGSAFALAALGAAAAAGALSPQRAWPSWPSYGAADAYLPPLASALALLTSHMAITTLLLLVTAAVHRFNGPGQRRRTDVAVALIWLSILLVGVTVDVRGPLASVVLEWLVKGVLVSVGLSVLYLVARRYDPAVIPVAAAVLLSARAVEQILIRPFPGALLGGGLGILVLAGAAAVWTRALRAPA